MPHSEFADSPASPTTDPILVEPNPPKFITNNFTIMGLDACPIPSSTVRNATIVISHGSGQLARTVAGATVLSDNQRLVAFQNSRPLETVTNIRRAAHEGTLRALSLRHVLNDSEWTVGTNLARMPSESAARIIIEQAHLDPEIEMTVREIARVGVKGTHFLLVGYEKFYVPALPDVEDWLTKLWETRLTKFLTKGERHLESGFRDLVIPSSREAFQSTGYTRGPQFLTKKLNAVEIIAAHFDNWPVVRRLTEAPNTAWFDIGQYRKQLTEHWGENLRKRYEVRWRPAFRWGVLD